MTNSSQKEIMAADHHAALDTALTDTLARCTQCGTCVGHCPFLQRYGTPLSLAKKYADQQLDPEVPFVCSLCRLCSVVCPEKLNPGELFWLMRIHLDEIGSIDFRQHKTILQYEKRGMSDLFSLFEIPPGCSTIFFPGCTFTGTRPKQLKNVFELLQRVVPDLGLVLSCCSKPSHDLGRITSFETSFKLVLGQLLDKGITKVLTTCPSCYQIFKQYGTGLEVVTVYELFDKKGTFPARAEETTVSVHDPCSVRLDPEIHAHVRSLLAKQGRHIAEMEHRGKLALCCGEGGSACFMPENSAEKLVRMREAEANGNPVIAYCAGCTGRLGSHVSCHHLIDLLLDPDATLAGKAKVSRPPFTYLNRFLVKRTYKNKL